MLAKKKEKEEKEVPQLYDLPACWRESASCLGRDLGLDSSWRSPLASNVYPEDGALKTYTNPVIMLLSSPAYVISSTFSLWLFLWPETITVSRWRHQEKECRIELETSHFTMEPSVFVGRSWPRQRSRSRDYMRLLSLGTPTPGPWSI